MELTLIELDINWPEEVSLEQLRTWIISHLKRHGEPLRWAITSIERPKSNTLLCKLKIEAVIITHSP